MKITYIANARIPTEKAHGIQIMKTCEAFSKSEVINPKSKNIEQVEVELVVPKRRNKIKEDPFEYYGVERSFKITYLPTLDLVGMLPKVGFWIQSLTFAQSAFWYGLFKKADVIYGRDEISLFYLSLWKKNVFWESHRGQYSLIVKWLLKRCRGLVVISQGLKDFYLSKGVMADKILVAPDGVDVEQFDTKIPKEEARRKVDLPKDSKIIMYTGHLYAWKGADILLEAAKQFSIPTPSAGEKSPNNILFVFVGGTENDVKKFKEKAKGLKNVLILGHKPHDVIPYYLKAADVLVLPNSGKTDISAKYTSPLKLFEYMASGRPIVASDLPSLREVLNENNAILVKTDSPNDLARGIKSVLFDDEKAGILSENVSIDVKRYTWLERARVIIEFFVR